MNAKQSKQKPQVVAVLSLFALAAVLSYTFWHTGALLSRYIIPGWLGYVAAAGVELTVIAMSIQFNLLSDGDKSPLSKGLFLFVFLATLTVSASANVAEGFRVAQGVELTSQTFGRMDWLVAVIGVSATGLLSLVVMSLAELLGDSFSVVLGIASDIGKFRHQDSSTVTQIDAFEAGRMTAIANRRDSKALALDMILATLRENPDATKAELAALIGKSRSTVANYLSELEQQGVISHNGDGLQVSEG